MFMYNNIMSLKLQIDNIIFSNYKKVKEWEVEDIRDKENKKIYFETPYMYLPFGLEKDYKNYILKLQFKGVKNNSNKEMIEFYDIINYFENKIIKNKNINKEFFKSQIIEKDNYDDILVIRINKKFYNINITNDNNDIKNIFDIEKKSEIKCKIHIDNIWNNNNIFTSKFILDEIIIKT